MRAFGVILAGASLLVSGLGYYRLDQRIGAVREIRPVALDAYLGLSEVAVEPGQTRYRPELVDAVRYTGNAMAATPRDMILQTRHLTPADRAVIWSAGLPLQPGDVLAVLDSSFHDLRAGTAFVRIRRRSDAAIGYIPLQTFIAKTVPVAVPDSPYPPLTASIEGRNILVPYPIGPIQTKSVLDEIDGKTLAEAFATPLTGGKVHPVTFGNHLFLLLLGIVGAAPDEATREKVLAAARRMFDEYAFPDAVSVRDTLAWPNTYNFPIPWGDELKAPWFSGYSNGTIAAASALMFRLTGEERYAGLARKAVAWMRLPADQGGPLYSDGIFRFVAEYPSRTPSQPNIGVLDGEMMAAITVYDTAVLLDDQDMLRFAAVLAYSLVNKSIMSTTADGRIQNSRYQWLINTESYILPMQRFAAILGIVTKDRRMLDLAKTWRQSDVYWPN